MTVHTGLHCMVDRVPRHKLVAQTERNSPKPTNVEVMVEDEHARDALDTLQLVNRLEHFAWLDRKLVPHTRIYIYIYCTMH